VRTRYEYQSGILLAEMIGRETAEETAQFVQGLLAALRERGGNRVLISVVSSRSLFKVEDWKLSAAVDTIRGIPGFRVAFIADSKEVGMSQEYICMLLAQRGIEGRAFQSMEKARAWLSESQVDGAG
jgi:hypothetical protein